MGLNRKPKQLRILGVNRAEIRDFTSWLGKRSYKARLERLGLERIQEIARENGKKGGRPVGTGKRPVRKGGK
jgi:galactokinase/mevalonate kinase-like predicted kinase